MSMKRKSTFFLCMAIAVLSLPLQAQVTLSSPTLTVDPESFFAADIRTYEFIDIQGVQFSIQWDPAVLEFQTVENFGIQLNDINFGLEQVDEGKLGFLWFDVNVEGVTLAEGDTLFTLIFKAIGDPGMTSFIEFGESPTAIEILDIQDNVLDAAFETGEVTIFNPSGSTRRVPDPEVLRMSGIRPNPFSAGTEVQFELSRSLPAEIALYGPAGRSIYVRQTRLGAGSNVIPLDEHLFPVEGIYLFKLNTAAGTITQKLIRQ